jgi:hypothetical protein
MDQNRFEPPRFSPRDSEHLLKDGASLIGTRRARLDVLGHQHGAMLLAPRLCLPDLVGD